MYYYKLKSDNSIEQFTEIAEGKTVPSFIAEEFTATVRKIIRLHDGKLAFEDETDMEAEAAAIAAQGEAQRIASMQPTEQERLDAIEEMLLALAGGDE